MQDRDGQFMSRALELAVLGRGSVEPNPTVGAVIVRDGKILGEGWHRRFGGPHAEVEALAACRAAGDDPAGATMYVTLEPCCHHGKTPPCTEAVIAAGIARVVSAMEDPDARVSGKGVAALRQAGIAVECGVMEPQARRLLRAYAKLRTQGRPYVICKWAQSLDGKIATHTGHSQWLSGPEARALVHRVRAHCDGICVGVGTVKTDDPLLTNRSGAGKQPARVVLDELLRMPLDCRLLGSLDVAPVIVATRQDPKGPPAETLRQAGAEILPLPPAPAPGAQGVDLAALLDELGRRQWTYLLVEGGRSVLGQFISAGLADELMVFVAPKLVGGKESLGPVDWKDIDTIDRALALPAPEVQTVGPDVLLRYLL